MADCDYTEGERGREREGGTEGGREEGRRTGYAIQYNFYNSTCTSLL